MLFSGLLSWSYDNRILGDISVRWYPAGIQLYAMMFGVLGIILGVLLAIVGIGFLLLGLAWVIFAALWIWFLVRSVIGLATLYRGDAYPRPRAWIV